MSKMIIDSHSHYDDAAFADDRANIINGLFNKNVEFVVNASADLRSITWTLNLCEKYDNVYGAIGIHPDNSKNLNEEIFNRLKEHCNIDKVVAVGEIGLDYYWDASSREIQKKWFRRQINLALEVNLPIIVHSRDSAADTFDIIKSDYNGGCGGVIHCFSYSPEMAERYLNLGFYIGIGGVVTFKNAKKVQDVVKITPIQKIVLETDCPYLAPAPFRGTRNDSTMIKYVAERIAEIKGLTPEEVIEITNKNARELYKIK